MIARPGPVSNEAARFHAEPNCVHWVVTTATTRTIRTRFGKVKTLFASAKYNGRVVAAFSGSLVALNRVVRNYFGVRTDRTLQS
jgi:hypothetical protein